MAIGGTMTPLLTSVISCRQRSRARAETIPQLEAAGLIRGFYIPCPRGVIIARFA